MRQPAHEKVVEWKHNANLFVREVFHAEPDAWQADVLEAVRTHFRLALKACKGPGKSTLLAWLGWWYLLTRPHPKLVATSISADNLRDNLWTEYAKWQQRSPLLKQAFQWNAERIVARQHPETWWASARAWPKSADANQQADTLAGVHGDYVMFQLDESGGIPAAVMATAEAGLANADPAKGTEAYLIQAGNPTQTSGPLYEACTRERKLWWVKEISSDPDNPQRTPRVSRQWALEQIEKYGRESPWVLVNVFGQFPPSQSNALIGIEEATQATRRVLAERDYCDEVKVLGVDVARFGDDRTVLFLRQGRAAFKPKVFRNLDTMQVAGQVALLMEKWEPDAVFVDVTGIGAGVVDRLKQLGHQVVGVSAAGKPTTNRHVNKRMETWDLMAQWMREGGCIPDDAELISELTAPTYFFARDGRMQLESKDSLKERGLPSPDKADALALTFAEPVASRAMRQRLDAKGPRAAHEYNPYEIGRT